MSFREILETSQSLALADRLYPDELATWHKYCREYSKTFSEPLSQVLLMDPLTVLTAIFSDQLDSWDLTERADDIQDLLGSLNDPEFDVKRERALREEMRKIEEEEKIRLQEGRAVHSSLEKDKRVIAKEEPKPLKELPKSGGINMNLIKSLANDGNETGEF